jgi:hypothetical protein
MKHPYLTVSCLACALLGASPWARAETGRIDFAGSIVEPACPLSDATPDCPAGHPVGAMVQPLDMASAQRDIPAALLAYALQRDRAASWQVVEVTYR